MHSVSKMVDAFLYSSRFWAHPSSTFLFNWITALILIFYKLYARKMGEEKKVVRKIEKKGKGIDIIKRARKR